MTPDAPKIQFSRQIWQAVSEHAHSCLLRREFCPEQSRVENLRCVEFLEEGENAFGKQVWFFEGIGVDAMGRRHMLFGILEFSIQFGLLEAATAALFEEEEMRERYAAPAGYENSGIFPARGSRKAWIFVVAALFSILAAVWTTAAINFLRS
jgi:hypothetical protein